MFVINKLKITLFRLKILFSLFVKNCLEYEYRWTKKFLPKKLSDTQKEEIIKGFMRGKNLDQLSEEFSCTKLTISRNIKKKFGEEEYKKLLKRNISFEKHNEKVKDSEENTDEKVFGQQKIKKLVEQDNGELFEDNNSFKAHLLWK